MFSIRIVNNTYPEHDNNVAIDILDIIAEIAEQTSIRREETVYVSLALVVVETDELSDTRPEY